VRRRRRGVWGRWWWWWWWCVCGCTCALAHVCVSMPGGATAAAHSCKAPPRLTAPAARAHEHTHTRTRARTQRTPAGDHAGWPIIVPSTPLSLVKGRVEGGGGWKVTVRAGTAPAHASPRHVFPGPANILCARDMHGTHASVLPPIA
jgi:hypothetical protein